MVRDKDFYKTYYINQAAQKGGNLPAFQGALSQRGYGIGSWLKGLYRWAVPKVSSAASAVGRAALKEGAGLAQDVLSGENVKESAVKRLKQTGKRAFNDMTSQNASQSQTGAGRKKGRKRKATSKSVTLASTKKRKTSPTEYPLFNEYGTPY